jgi:threonine dehydrogenase-like Zn-dependent dehydrogenase
MARGTFSGGVDGSEGHALAAVEGASVQISDPHPERRELAVRFGAGPADGGPVDIAFDFSGSSAAVDAALSRLDLGGKPVLAGSVAPAPASPSTPRPSSAAGSP